jgi:hypothetical protein
MKEIHDFRLKVDPDCVWKGSCLSAWRGEKKDEKVEVTATLQCSGNKSGGFNDLKRTSGNSVVKVPYTISGAA